jgi:hypothetical protein
MKKKNVVTLPGRGITKKQLFFGEREEKREIMPRIEARSRGNLLQSAAYRKITRFGRLNRIRQTETLFQKKKLSNLIGTRNIYNSFFLFLHEEDRR